ncbi:hydantoinase/oxoprolinase family protein [Candidatus Methanocrinis natronophilus]|uniref:Hydantoinase/oxoprolinase family protein n=1 Tax=Candidatus Methanocrinis natronophilus TaxID=3033396 RepID=A0ABT5X5G8_9EURY|nr:hydantoinase/oxoprolinase family protein [Candidatus Methanocrinis natronophilus]MDF0589936.1 hydantoinase/oxoprolinase family protein [Candidatus Methanocrinis natronophilus]
MILGLDVGGANTKAASSDGLFTKIEYLPLWKEAPLIPFLRRISAEAAPEALAVVMTGELADTFPDKRTGVLAIMGAVKRAFSCPVSFWGVDGFGWSEISDLAAANWSASAALVSQEIGDSLFVDMGSTTTDLIPIKGRAMAARTDFERLGRGELIYSGLLRTNLAALLGYVEIKRMKVPLSSELFAVTADAHLVGGRISEGDYAVEPPDGGVRDRQSALRRLARTVCADLGEIGPEAAEEIGRQAAARQLSRLTDGIRRQSQVHNLSLVVAAGIGDGLIEEAARDLGLECVRLSKIYGSRVSDAFPAYAAARLLEMRMQAPGRRIGGRTLK